MEITESLWGVSPEQLQGPWVWLAEPLVLPGTLPCPPAPIVTETTLA